MKTFQVVYTCQPVLEKALSSFTITMFIYFVCTIFTLFAYLFHYHTVMLAKNGTPGGSRTDYEIDCEK